MTEVERGVGKFGLSRTSTMPGPAVAGSKVSPSPARFSWRVPFSPFLYPFASQYVTQWHIIRFSSASQRLAAGLVKCNMTLRNIYDLVRFAGYIGIQTGKEFNMAFNSRTYHCNKYRKQALAELAQAREIKSNPDAYDWQTARIPTLVKLARSSWRIYLSLKGI